MQKPEDDTTSPEYLKRSAFTCSAVYADLAVSGTEKPLRTSHDDLKGGQRSLEDLREQEQELLAVVVQRDAFSDKEVNEFVARLLLLVGKDYAHPTYRRYVPGSVRDITQADMRTEEPVLVAEIIKMLGEDKALPGIDALATEFIPRLQKANDAVILAEAALVKIEADATHLEKKTIPALMVAWSTEYTKLHAALTAAWPLDADRVERCFKPFRKPKKKAKKVPPPVHAGPTGAALGTDSALDDTDRSG